MEVSKQVVILYDFEAQESDELPLNMGDVVTVLQQVNDTWLMVSLFSIPSFGPRQAFWSPPSPGHLLAISWSSPGHLLVISCHLLLLSLSPPLLFLFVFFRFLLLIFSFFSSLFEICGLFFLFSSLPLLFLFCLSSGSSSLPLSYLSLLNFLFSFFIIICSRGNAGTVSASSLPPSPRPCRSRDPSP